MLIAPVRGMVRLRGAPNVWPLDPMKPNGVRDANRRLWRSGRVCGSTGGWRFAAQGGRWMGSVFWVPPAA